MMANILDLLLENEKYRGIVQKFNTSNKDFKISVNGASESQKAHFCSALLYHTASRGIFVAYNELEAKRIYEDFKQFLGERVLFYPAREITLYDIEFKSYDLVFSRVTVLDKICRQDYVLVVASIEAVLQKLPSPILFARETLQLKQGSKIDIAGISSSLVEMGYLREARVESKGTFSIRGGIIDIFPVNSEQPCRIELFDDEIDSIRNFDPDTQRSENILESVVVCPAREVIYKPAHREGIISRINKHLHIAIETLLEKGIEKEEIEKLKQKVNADIERFCQQYYFAGIDKYIPVLFEEHSSIFDYMKEAVIYLDEPSMSKKRADNFIREISEISLSLYDKHQLLPCGDILFDFSEIQHFISSRNCVFLNSLGKDRINEYIEFNLASRSIPSYHSQMDMFLDDIKRWRDRNFKIAVLSGTQGRGKRLAEVLSEAGIESEYCENFDKKLGKSRVFIAKANISKGFESIDGRFVVISDSDIFAKEKRQRKSFRKAKGVDINLFSDLNIGDYVVHQTHGVGQYAGIQNLVVDNVKKDYLKIVYQGGDYLYIPVTQLDLIQKYIGSEGKAPKLNKLGGSEWQKTKAKVKESLKDLAEELVKLYAQRQNAKGYKFSKDTVWQKQFEDLFPYEETPDQLRCIEEVKKDMESEKVMDRLLCGDVGYGKTEVAIRAIFKAVMDGKQVAYLVPTTILAQQHYMNFRERFKDFPVIVEVLSRFKTASEQKNIIKDLKAGLIDVLIGTHRLLQKDVQFKDLGLLVVDEEQRFGVSHKEKLKALKTNVDVLTLTATPIPRTLHMSLVGIRDISVLEDPPEERYPVQTYVMEYDEEIVKDAIIRELARKGQVFYLYNSVRSINIKADSIAAMVPEARVAVAHGQMSENELEDVMQSFINKEYDILVCTTIIESGLDMPNVNTIIVEDADKMGLAQLYQIRGRVGRSNRLAFAYITYRRDKILPEIAQKRLQAIREFTEFGSGFKIAMRDLEIRGAGNLLGPQQHGHMDAVGYDMYCRLLEQAVREVKGEEPQQEKPEILIDININAYIDSMYIQDEASRLEMYKKIASIENEQDEMEIIDELADRYGDVPQEVKNLIDIALIKSMASLCGFSSIVERQGSIVLQYAKERRFDIDKISRLGAKYRNQLLAAAGKSPHIAYKIQGMSREKLLANIKILLQDIIY